MWESMVQWVGRRNAKCLFDVSRNTIRLAMDDKKKSRKKTAFSGGSSGRCAMRFRA